MAGGIPPEIIVCDTSLVSRLAARRIEPERFEHWPASDINRLEKARLAISVVTVAEARYGYRLAQWGQRKIADYERRIRAFLHIPLDDPDIDEWARLKHFARKSGNSITDNDLWIAATASTRGHPLATCDKDQLRLEAQMQVPVIYFPPKPNIAQP